MLARARLLLALLLLPILLGAVLPARAQGDGFRPPSARLNGLRHEFQTWNNCGPVNLTMALSYYGWPHNQTVTAAWLKPNPNDKNVSPAEMVAFVEQQTELPELRALWRYGGDLETLRRLIAAGFPVIVESGFQPPGHDWMGHYITVVAYDDVAETLWTYDSYTGYGVGYGEETAYAEFDAWWRHFNRVFVVIYPVSRSDALIAALGPLLDPSAADQVALDVALAEMARDPADLWAVFNAGTSAAALGQYAHAAALFDAARALTMPTRMLWYQFGPYDAYYHTGRYYDVLTLGSQVETVTDEVEETHYWMGLAWAALGDSAAALRRMDTALLLNPHAGLIRATREQIAAGAYRAPAALHLSVPPLP